MILVIYDYRDLDSDAEYDASDEVVAASGVLSINSALEVGTITFTQDFVSSDAQNYIVVADWTHRLIALL